MPSITDAVQSATNAVAASTSAALAGVNGNMSAAQAALAPNAWVGAADNKLATADVYAPPGQPAVITDIQNLFQQFNFSIADVLRGGKYIASQAGAISRDIKMLTSGDILSRVLGASALTKTALNALGVAGLGNIANTINSGINMAEGAVGAAVGSVANEIYADLGGVVQQVSSAAASGLSAVGACINSLGVSASFSLADNGAKVSLFAGLIQTASGYGMQNSYGSLIASISDRNMIGQITMQVLPNIISASDTSSLRSIGITLGARNAYAYNPNLLANFSSSYQTPTAASFGQPTDYSGAFTDITDAYSAVDPNWSQYTRPTTVTDPDTGAVTTQPDQAFNLNTIMNGSSDFQQVVTQGVTSTPDRTNNVMALATAIPQTSVASQLATQFPLTVFSGNSQAANVTQDPLAIAQGAPPPVVPASYSASTPNTGSTDGQQYDIADATIDPKTGFYVWPDGHFQVGGSHAATATSQGYTSKGITFD
jgi:hypothetical protein